MVLNEWIPFLTDWCDEDDAQVRNSLLLITRAQCSAVHMETELLRAVGVSNGRHSSRSMVTRWAVTHEAVAAQTGKIRTRTQYAPTARRSVGMWLQVPLRMATPGWHLSVTSMLAPTS